MFDAMTALSSKYNSNPETASRAYDKNRDGFVIAGGAGVLVLEELEHAKARGAKIYAELTGYGATSDGYDMVAPSGHGAEECMRNALESFEGNVDYINAHGTSTTVGDVAEINAIQKVFTDNDVKISSTKSLTGHSLGATGAQEIIFSLLMMNNNFISPSINLENVIKEADGLNIITDQNDISFNSFMSNSFGFGGTNSCLIFEKN